jgi:hypothetical protein
LNVGEGSKNLCVTLVVCFLTFNLKPDRFIYVIKEFACDKMQSRLAFSTTILVSGLPSWGSGFVSRKDNWKSDRQMAIRVWAQAAVEKY